MAVRRRDWRDGAAFVAGFVLPLTLFAMWLMQHPDAVQETARRYGWIGGTQPATAGAMLQTFDAGALLARYVNFFRFDFLFQLGDTYLPFSTRTTGVFVGASGVLIAAGLYSALDHSSRGAGDAGLAGLLAVAAGRERAPGRRCDSPRNQHAGVWRAPRGNGRGRDRAHRPCPVVQATRACHRRYWAVGRPRRHGADRMSPRAASATPRRA